MGEACGRIDYGAESARQALQLWGDDAPDHDPDRRADLERALEALTDQEAQALRLWSWGFKNTEIAERLGLSEMQASRLAARAIANLRRGMNDDANGAARRKEKP